MASSGFLDRRSTDWRKTPLIFWIRCYSARHICVYARAVYVGAARSSTFCPYHWTCLLYISMVLREAENVMADAIGGLEEMEERYFGCDEDLSFVFSNL